jgi:hypothetical protein
LFASKGTVQVYWTPFCSKIVGVWTVSSIQPRISFEATIWNCFSSPHAAQRKTEDRTLRPLWEERIKYPGL